MKNTKLNLILLAAGLLFSFNYINSTLAEDDSKIDCLIGSPGNDTLLLSPSVNNALVGQDITLNCMGKPGAFTGDTILDLDSSTGDESIATVTPQTMTVSVNQDGSTTTAQFIIMSFSAGSTDIAVDFSGTMNFDILDTLWDFQKGSGSMSGSSSNSSGNSESSSGDTSTDLCSGAINGQCATGHSRKNCKSCCSSVAAIASNKKCKSKCLKKCKKLK